MKPARNIVLYDDACPLCVFQMRMISWLDWCHTTTLTPLSLAHERGVGAGISQEDLRSALHCLPPDRRVYRGARAIRFLGMRIPLLVPLALVLWIPGVIFVAERVYMWVSRNRHLLSRLFGCREACALLPPKPREGEQELGSIRGGPSNPVPRR